MSIGPWLVDTRHLRLVDGEQERRLNPKAMAVLLHLARRRGQLVSKNELVDSAWGGRAVSDDALFVCIHELRKALGDQARSPRFIQTVHGEGYRWLPEVEWLDEVESPAAAEISPPGETGAPSSPALLRPTHPTTQPGWLAAWLLGLLVTVGALASWHLPERIRLAHTPAPEAVEAYLDGHYELFQGTDGGGGSPELGRAIVAFGRAIALEPDYVDAYVGLAQSHLARLWTSEEDWAVDRTAARRAAAQAMRLAPDLAAAHTVRGQVRMSIDHDLEVAESSFRRALELDPSAIEAYRGYAWLLLAQRRYGQAATLARRAMRVDPLSPKPLRLYARILSYRGRPAAVLEQVEHLEHRFPGAGEELRRVALMDLERYDQAWPAQRRALAAEGLGEGNLQALDAAYRQQGPTGLL
ncbi:MAG: winged helix-turn-helix domain-containing protein, partial [Acidobacteriota bacterium]